MLLLGNRRVKSRPAALPSGRVVRPRVAGHAAPLERAAERHAQTAEKLAVPIVFSAAVADDHAGPSPDDVPEPLAGRRRGVNRSHAAMTAKTARKLTRRQPGLVLE